MYWSGVEANSRRGRPHGRWKDRVKEYLSERGVRGNGLEQKRRECNVWIGNGGGVFAVATPLENAPEGSEVSQILTD